MKNNSKSGLKIKQIIVMLPILIILSTNLQLFIFSKSNNSKTVEIDTEEKAQIAEQDMIYNSERNIETTSRSNIERKPIENSNEETYISIEEITISKNMDLTKRCGISKEDFKELIKNLKVDKSEFFYRNSDKIYDLCEKYQLNEIFFCGLIGAESGWNIAPSHRNKCNYISMMSKGKLIKYSSEEEGLEAAAKLLHSKYLTKGGLYYKGKTLSSVQKIFCPNSSTWVNLVYGCMKQVIE